MNRKRIAILLLALTVTTSVAKPIETKANPQEVVQQSVEMAPSLGPLAPIVVAGGLVIASGLVIYEMVKIPRLPDKGNPNSRAIKYHPITKEPIQYRYYDNDGNTRLDIDLTDHGKPEYHPHVPHRHTYENGSRMPGQEMTDVEKDFYLGN